MLKYLGFLIAIFCVTPAIADGWCTADLPVGSAGGCGIGKYRDTAGNCQICPENYYCPDGLHAKCCNTNTGGNAGSLSNYPNSTAGATKKEECTSQQINCGGGQYSCTLTYGGVSNCVNMGTGSVDNGVYHLESLSCVSNQDRSCLYYGWGADIPISSWLGNGSYTSDDRVDGTVTWDVSTQKWDVSNCKLVKNNFDITGKNCRGTVRRFAILDGNAVTGFSIKYYNNDINNAADFYYCTYCGAGKQPNFMKEDYDIACFYDDNIQNYVACECEDVEAGYYSIGCNLPSYPWDEAPAIPAACHQQCPANTTTEGGAQNINQCVPTDGQYCDAVGCFTLGATACN